MNKFSPSSWSLRWSVHRLWIRLIKTPFIIINGGNSCDVNTFIRVKHRFNVNLCAFICSHLFNHIYPIWLATALISFYRNRNASNHRCRLNAKCFFTRIFHPFIKYKAWRPTQNTSRPLWKPTKYPTEQSSPFEFGLFFFYSLVFALKFVYFLWLYFPLLNWISNTTYSTLPASGLKRWSVV